MRILRADEPAEISPHVQSGCEDDAPGVARDDSRGDSIQAHWLRAQLAASTSAWNIVYDHHPPYSSDDFRGSTAYMQWPFAAWGADAVISGHGHTYERIMRDGIPYFVNGLGGGPRYGFATPVTGSVARYRADWGAQKVTVTDATLDFEFRSVAGALVDHYRSGSSWK